MRHLLFGLLAGSWIVLALDAQERIALSTPEAAPSLTQYRLDAFRIEEDNPNTPTNEARMIIDLEGVQRVSPVRCEYNASTTPTGQFLVNGLKNANMSSAYAGNATTGNLHQRIFHRLVVMGESAQVCNKNLSGTVQ